MTGSEPAGSDPVLRARFEEARRQLYSPDPPADAEAEYERLRIAIETTAAPSAPPAAGAHRLRLPRLLLIACAGTLICGFVAFPRLPPERLPVPESPAGETIVAFDREHVDGVGPGVVTYQPTGYEVHQPDRRRVQVRLVCAGRGSVVIAAGTEFRFRCGTDTSTSTVTAARPPSKPYVVIGTTVGDVVWAATVSALPEPPLSPSEFYCGVCGAQPFG